MSIVLIAAEVLVSYCGFKCWFRGLEMFRKGLTVVNSFLTPHQSNKNHSQIPISV